MQSSVRLGMQGDQKPGEEFYRAIAYVVPSRIHPMPVISALGINHEICQGPRMRGN